MFEKTEKKSQTSKNTGFLTDVSRYKIHQAIRVKTDIMILSSDKYFVVGTETFKGVREVAWVDY